jgi:hypothetical protein
MIDVYQAATQMTDESDQAYPFTINTLLDRALGAEGYYGVFTANMHTDYPSSPGADAIVSSALARGVPVVSARQMLTWLDGRNASTYKDLTWNGAQLGFRIEVGIGARGLRAMVPAAVSGYDIASITADGAPVTYAVETIKGVAYATFEAATSAYVVSYSVPAPDTTITSAPPASTSSQAATFAFASTPAGASFQCSLDGAAFTACASPVSYSGLATGAHSFSVRAVAATGTDASPAVHNWTIAVAVPDTTITSGPTGLTSSRTATFQFTSTVSGSTFQCSLDGAAFTSCVSGIAYSSLADGSHTFLVRAVSAGGADASPASRTWTVDGSGPVISSLAATALTTSATITWTTNEASDSVVNYGTSSSSLTQSATVSTMVTAHSVTLTGLTAGRTYYYRVSSRNAAGLTTTSPSTPATFVTRTVVTQAPGSATITSGSLRSGSASNLATNNGSYYQVNSTSGGTRTSTWYGSFTGVSRSLANLTVTYSGMQSRTVTQNIEIYQWSTGTWVLLNSRSVGTTEQTISNLTPSGAAANYVSTGGDVRVRVRSVGASTSFYTVADHLQIGFDRP